MAADGERSFTAPCESGVPQGPVLGPLLFSLYVAPVSNIAVAHHVSIHQYTDDIQAYIAIQPQCPDGLSQLVNCTDDITHFETRLLLNPYLTLRQWHSKQHPDCEVRTLPEVLRWLAPASSFRTYLSFLVLSSTRHFLWTGMYPASSVPATFIPALCATSVHVSHLMLPNLLQ